MAACIWWFERDARIFMRSGTIYCPELLDMLAPGGFGVLLGKMKTTEAIAYGKRGFEK